MSVPVRCNRPVTVQLDVSAGVWYGDLLRSSVRLTGGAGFQEARFSIPWCDVDALRLHLKAGAPAAGVDLGPVEIVGVAEEKLGWNPAIPTLPATAFGAPPETVASLTPLAGGAMHVEGPGEIVLVAPFNRALSLGFNTPAFLTRLALDALIWLVAGGAALFFWRRRLGMRRVGRRFALGQVRFHRALVGFCRRRIHAAIWLAALAGVLLSCFPVVFCGKSFVSPNNHPPLLYDRLPSVPGYHDVRPMNVQLSDVSAIQWAFLPYAMLERRALFVDHELPVWNRDNAGGVPLLGQGQSMIGDPLHWLAILANGASWAWDLKCLLAKLLFGAGIGSAVWAATRHRPASLLLAFTSCFISFFVFRFSHSTYFSVCYSPWILCACLLLARGGGRRCVGLLLLANWIELNSGTAKEASVILIALNLAGALAFLLEQETPWPRKARRLAAISFAGVCFTLISAPLLLTFFDTLAHSWNSYQVPAAWQIQPGLFLGLFDDIYYRQFNGNEELFNPGLNFVALVGFAFAVGYFKRLVLDRLFLGVLLGALPLLAVVFGVFSSPWLRSFPILGNIIHADSTFSCPLMICVLVLAGFGFRECWRQFQARDWPLDALTAVAVLAVLFSAFLGLTHSAQITTYNPKKGLVGLEISVFCWRYTAALFAAFAALPLVLRRMARDRGVTLAGLAPVLGLCLFTMLWRHALQPPGVSLRYVMTPGVRADLRAPSPAVNFVLERQRETPARTMGFGSILAPGFNAVYGLESPSGADALQNRHYHELLARSGLTYAFGWYLMADRTAFANYRKFLDLLNVRYYFDQPIADPAPAGLRRLASFDLDVFASESVWPRAFFTDTLATHAEPIEFYQQVAKGDGRPFASVLAAELPPAVAALPRDGAAREVTPATDYRCTSATTAFRVHAPRPGIAVLLEGFQDTGIEATVDGRPVSRFRVDSAFDGVYLPTPGDHLVCFRYWPRFLTLGLWLSALGSALLAGGAIVWRPARTLPEP